MMETKQYGSVTLIHGDCMEFMKELPDKSFDLACVDPPYGINVNSNMGRRKGQKKRHIEKKWDKSIPDDLYFNELFKISINQIIWGGNYFDLGISKCIIWWEKFTPEGMSFSDGELAWTSFNRANKSFKFYNVTNDKIHPTEKPVALYEWLLKNYAKPGQTILDTHAGSFSSAVAALKMGFTYTGLEIDADYFKAGCERVEAVYEAMTLGYAKTKLNKIQQTLF